MKYTKTLSLALYFIFFCSVVYAQPSITSFTPVAGNVGTSVTITGNGFSATPADNIVYFGAVKANVTAATTTSLTVTVPPGASSRNITVTTGNLTAYSRTAFVVTFPGGNSNLFDSYSFASPQFYGTSIVPVAISSKDMNDDGKPDIVVANSTSNQLSVYINTTTGKTFSFTAAQTFSTALSPTGIATADIDGDGLQDVLISNEGSNSFSVFRNISSGGNFSLAPKVDFTTATHPKAISVGDINADGKPDVATANYTSKNISVFRNTSTPGNISFTTKSDFSPGNANLNTVAMADIDGDGKADIATAAYPILAYYRSTSTAGTISFAPTQNTSISYLPSKLTFGDLNNNGKSDLVAVSGSSNNILIYHNNSTLGNIEMSATTTILTSVNYFDVDISDFNGDGKPDLTATSLNASRTVVFRNTSTTGITFGGSTFYSGGFTRGVSIGDFNRDGMQDIVAGEGSGLNVYRNKITEPGIDSFAPDTASAGTTVTIDGRNFTNTTLVRFGGVAVSSFTVVNDTTINAVVGAGGSGSVVVANTKDTVAKSGFIFTATVPMCPNGNVELTTPFSGTYQWQVDRGSGYVNLADSGSTIVGVTNDTLRITGAPSTWYGFKYRCLIYGSPHNANLYTLIFRNEGMFTVNNNWHDTANWSCGVLPDENTDVVISSGTIVISSNVTIRTLSLAPGVTLTISPGATLTVLL